MKKGFLLLVVFWVGLIGWFSAQTLQTSTHQTYEVIEKLNLATEKELVQSGTDDIRQLKYFMRKSAHFILYFILGCILSVSLYIGYGFTGRLLIKRAWLIGTIMGIFDEFHQYFTPGRSMQVKDMLIDSSGVFLGTALLTTLIVWFVANGVSSDEQEELNS